MSDEAAAPGPIRPSEPGASGQGPTASGQKKTSILADWRNRIRSRLSTNQFKSLQARWRDRKPREAEDASATRSISSSEAFEDVPLDPYDYQLPSSVLEETIESENSSIEVDVSSSSEIQDIQLQTPLNSIDNNFASSAIEPETSISINDSFPSVTEDLVDSSAELELGLPSFLINAEGLEGLTEDSEEASVATTADSGTEADSSGVPGPEPELPAMPPTIIGVQIQRAAGFAGRLLDMVPLIYIQGNRVDASDSNLLSTSGTDDSSYRHSGSEDTSGVSSSSRSVIEILTSAEETNRRIEAEFIRPYYDPSVKQTVKKPFRRLDDDPPIY